MYADGSNVIPVFDAAGVQVSEPVWQPLPQAVCLLANSAATGSDDEDILRIQNNITTVPNSLRIHRQFISYCFNQG
jgi:hypothetical protein